MSAIRGGGMPPSALRHGPLLPWLLLAPAIVGLLIFRVGPTLMVGYASFTRWDVRNPPVWTGGGNYSRLLSDPTFWLVLRNTIVFSLVFVPLCMVVGFLLAWAVNRPLRGVHVVRGMLFVPFITTMVAVGFLWSWIFSTRYGLLNWFLGGLGFSNPPAWLADPKYALLVLATVAFWKTVGFQMLLYVAAFQSIPRELLDAARIDGATWWQQVWYVVLPVLRPATFFILIITIIEGFKTFEVTFIMTAGGPNNASSTLAYAIYERAFVHGQMGYASTQAVALTALVGLVTWTSFVWRRRTEQDDAV